MPFWSYVLRSDSTGQIYIGHTSDLERRLQEHNDRQRGKYRYTRRQKGPWRLTNNIMTRNTACPGPPKDLEDPGGWFSHKGAKAVGH